MTDMSCQSRANKEWPYDQSLKNSNAKRGALYSRFTPCLHSNFVYVGYVQGSRAGRMNAIKLFATG